jgi:integrin alpha FG-GAP repeat containing protein 1
MGAQLSQTSYLSLQTPYLLFGLGRTSNYIEQVFYGTTSSSSKSTKMWICIIPNAQLVSIPYPSDQSDNWTLELFIKTSSLTAWVVVAFLTCLLINALVIGAFVWQERVILHIFFGSSFSFILFHSFLLSVLFFIEG